MQMPSRCSRPPTLLVAGTGFMLALMLAGCGYKGALYMPAPPPPPEQSLTLPPTPGNVPAGSANQPGGQAAQPSSTPGTNIIGK